MSLEALLTTAIRESVRDKAEKAVQAASPEKQMKALEAFRAGRPSASTVQFKVGDIVTRKPGTENIDYQFPYPGTKAVITAVLPVPVPSDKGDYFKLESVVVACCVSEEEDAPEGLKVVEYLMDPDWLVLAE